VNRPAARAAAALAGLLLSAACATGPRPEPDPSRDPWERVNRPVFHFNEKLDDYVLSPVSKAWTFVTPEFLRHGVANFYRNASFPQRLVSSVGQAEGNRAASEVCRFVINTLFGFGGFFDPATGLGLERYDEDVGQMFGRWGIPSGPYMVLPLIGPLNPRDAVGGAIDAALNPLVYVAPVGFGVVFVVNARALADKDIDAAKRSALDYYVFVRAAYVQRRAVLIRNGPLAADDVHGGLYDLYEYSDEPEDPGVDHAPTP
jgi:phospholipid-binding lipoprotein MlaA